MSQANIRSYSDFYEGVQYTEPSLPIHFCRVYFRERPHHEINCHWHNDFEFVYMEKDSCEYCLSGTEQSTILREGDGVFINSRTLHRGKSEVETACMKGFTLSPLFFGGGTTGAVYTKYVYPVLNLPVSGLWLRADNEADRQILADIKEISDIDIQSGGGELLCLEKVCKLWRALGERLSGSALFTVSAAQKQQETRTRAMLSYIHARYAEDITVDDIAGFAGVSRTECFRCFRNDVGKGPIEYLLAYRLSQAARLLAESDKSAAEVSEACGFHSSSYFGSKFKQRFGVPPKQFAKPTGGYAMHDLPL